MRVAIIQSCYIPWRGYFDIIDSVDFFLIFDDVQFPVGRSWRNRNRVKTPRGLQWLTVPLREKQGLSIDQVEIGEAPRPWRDQHRRLLHESLANAPHFGDALRLWNEAVSADTQYISALNFCLIKAICDYLAITTPIVTSRHYAASGAKTGRLIDLLVKVGATTYVSGPVAKDYLDEDMFRRHNIALEYKSYDYPPYPQLYGDFESAVTVLDLIANCGPQARQYLSSHSPNQIAVPRSC